MLALGYLTFPADDCYLDDSCNGGPAMRRNGAIVSVTGLVLTTAGLLALLAAGPDRPEAPPPPPPDPYEAEHQRAKTLGVVSKMTWDLAKAARENDCDRVRRRAPQVPSLAPDFYTDVFLRDVAIADCMAPAATAAPASTATPSPSPSTPPLLEPAPPSPL